MLTTRLAPGVLVKNSSPVAFVLPTHLVSSGLQADVVTELEQAGKGIMEHCGPLFAEGEVQDDHADGSCDVTQSGFDGTERPLMKYLVRATEPGSTV